MKKIIAYVFIGTGILTIMGAAFVTLDVHQRQIRSGSHGYDEFALFFSIAFFGGLIIKTGWEGLRK